MDIMKSQITTPNSLKETTAALLREETMSEYSPSKDQSFTDWLLEGLMIEDEQYVLQAYHFYNLKIRHRIRIRQLLRSGGRYPTADEKINIESKRYRLANRIGDFHANAVRLLGPSAVSMIIGTADRLDPDGYVSDDLRLPEERAVQPSLSEIENTIIAFPSSVAHSSSRMVTNLRDFECRLRHGKANDTLGRVREALSGLSYEYINKVRQAVTTKDQLRSYDGVKLLSKEVSFRQQVYNRNSRAIVKLDPSLKTRYPTLHRSDCTMSAAISDVNSRGESQTRLPWFWGAIDGWDEEMAKSHDLLNNDRLLECESPR